MGFRGVFVEPPSPRDVVSRDASVVVRRANGSISAAGAARPSQSELLFQELDALEYSQVVEG